ATHNQTELLEDGEFETLQGLLKLIRHQDQWPGHFLNRLATVANQTIDTLSASTVSSDLIESWYNDATNKNSKKGILQHIGDGGGYAEISESEFMALRNCLAVLRGSDWLSDHVRFECDRYAAGERRTPMQAIQGIIGTEVGGFQTNVDITRRMVKDY